MMHVLDLLADLDNPDLFPHGVPEPDEEVYRKDIVIGTLDDERIKRLYTLCNDSKEGAKNALRNLGEAVAKGGEVRVHADAHRLYDDRSRALQILLAIVLQEHYGIPWANLSLRKGWKVALHISSF